MAKKPKLTPVLEPDPERPKRKGGKPPPADAGGSLQKPDAPPDLSHIAEDLRGLAVPIAQWDFDPANARTHGDKNLSAIRASLRSFGQVRPLVGNSRTGTIVCGNGTLQAALALGWTWIAVVKRDLDPAAAASLAIADNRSAELADWDKDALDKLLRSIQTDDQDLADMLSALAKDEGIVPKEEDGAGDQPELPAKFELLVDCKVEAVQQELFERLSGEGLACKVLTL